jgi:hypothetical protein
VWLLAAALYTALTLFLSRPVADAWPLPPPANETVRAKQPLKATKLGPDGEGLWEQVAAAPATEPKTERRNEWVQIAGYTTVVRSRPSSASPALFAYAAGRPLRVIAREAGFVRVQDLGSGQLGWVKETALGPLRRGYRQREHQAAGLQVAVAEPRETVAESKNDAVTAKKVQQPRTDAIAARPKKGAVAAIEAGDRRLFRKRRDRIQRVALGGRTTGVAALVDRAFRGF